MFITDFRFFSCFTIFLLWVDWNSISTAGTGVWKLIFINIETGYLAGIFQANFKKPKSASTNIFWNNNDILNFTRENITLKNIINKKISRMCKYNHESGKVIQDGGKLEGNRLGHVFHQKKTNFSHVLAIPERFYPPCLKSMGYSSNWWTRTVGNWDIFLKLGTILF